MNTAKLTVAAPILIILAMPFCILGALAIVGAAPMLAPILVVAAHFRAKKDSQPDSVRLLCMEGLEGRQESPLKDRIRVAVGRMWAKAQPGAQPVVCTCVKRGEGGAYYGVLRMRSADGHVMARLSGKSPAAVGRQVLGTIEDYEREFPTLDPNVRETPECNSGNCHLKNQSVFDRAHAPAMAPAMLT